MHITEKFDVKQEVVNAYRMSPTYGDLYVAYLENQPKLDETIRDPDNAAEYYSHMEETYEFFHGWLKLVDAHDCTDSLEVYNERRMIETYGYNYLDRED